MPSKEAGHYQGQCFFGRNQGGRLGLERQVGQVNQVGQVGQVAQVGAETFQPSHQTDTLEFPPQIY